MFISLELGKAHSARHIPHVRVIFNFTSHARENMLTIFQSPVSEKKHTCAWHTQINYHYKRINPVPLAPPGNAVIYMYIYSFLFRSFSFTLAFPFGRLVACVCSQCHYSALMLVLNAYLTRADCNAWAI